MKYSLVLSKDRMALLMGLVFVLGAVSGWLIGRSMVQQPTMTALINDAVNTNAVSAPVVEDQPAGSAVASKYTANIVEVGADSIVVRPVVSGDPAFKVTLTVDAKTVLRAMVPLTGEEIIEKAGQKELYANWDAATKGPPPPLPAVDDPYKEETYKLSDFKPGDLVDFETYLPPDKGTTVAAVSVTWLSGSQRSNSGIPTFPETGGYPAPAVK